MAMEHKSYDNNSESHGDATQEPVRRHGFIFRHPVVSLIMLLIILSGIGYYTIGLLLVLVSFLVISAAIFLMMSAALSTTGGVFDEYEKKGMRFARRFRWNGGNDGERNPHDGERHPIPGNLHELVLDHDPDAVMIVSEYDAMMDVVDGSGLDSDTIRASYDDRMKQVGALISDYRAMSNDEHSKVSLRGIEDDYRKSLRSLTDQFHKTIDSANRGKVMDMKSTMSSLRDDDAVDDNQYDILDRHEQA